MKITQGAIKLALNLDWKESDTHLSWLPLTYQSYISLKRRLVWHALAYRLRHSLQKSPGKQTDPSVDWDLCELLA